MRKNNTTSQDTLKNHKINSQKQPQYIQELNDSTNENLKNKYFDQDFIKQVIKNRIDSKLTQKQFAMKLNENENRIKKFEQYKEVYDSAFMIKLSRVINNNNKS